MGTKKRKKSGKAGKKIKTAAWIGGVATLVTFAYVLAFLWLTGAKPANNAIVMFYVISTAAILGVSWIVKRLKRSEA